jgi:hypothetical protein
VYYGGTNMYVDRMMFALTGALDGREPRAFKRTFKGPPTCRPGRPEAGADAAPARQAAATPHCSHRPSAASPNS